eukprot:m.100572 g.100572  ORF g.100572 m.100572 type:complete len:402 (+) comp14061_c4_seq3:1113-2318(+)
MPRSRSYESHWILLAGALALLASTPSTRICVNAQTAYACAGNCSVGYCALQNTSINCAPNLCIQTCALAKRWDVAAFFLCQPPGFVDCSNVGTILTTWCPMPTPFFAPGTLTPACYADAIASCVSLCSAPSRFMPLVLPSQGTLIPLRTVNALSPSDTIFTNNDRITSQGISIPNLLDAFANTSYTSTFKQNSSFTVVPISGYSIVTGISITTANDCPECDPTLVIIESSNAVDSAAFYSVSFFDLTTNAAYMGDTTRGKVWTFSLPSLFLNTIPHNIYRLRFPLLRDTTTASSLKIANMQLLGLACSISDLALPSNATTNCTSSTGSLLLGVTCTVTAPVAVSSCNLTLGFVSVNATRTCVGVYPPTPLAISLSSSNSSIVAPVSLNASSRLIRVTQRKL